MAKETNIEIFDASRASTRIALAVFVLIALLFGWFAVRWQLGNMLAELTQPNDPNAKEIAQFALNLSPNDPMANWLNASTKKNVFNPDALNQTAESFARVVKLSPNDYRWWVELGRAREQAEDFAAAEKSFLRAAEIAPAYTYPRWQLGNFYLRQNRSEEAYAELKKAAQPTTVYRDQVFSVVWDFWEQDRGRLDAIAGDSPTVRAGLAKFYASRQQAEDALRVWNTLSEADKRDNEVIARVIALAFYQKRFYRQSQEFVRDLGVEPETKFETIQNAGFESAFPDGRDNFFNWGLVPQEKLEVKFDPTQKREGRRSLRVVFNGFVEPTLYNINQYVTVERGQKYRLTFWVRTENLKSGGNPGLEIYNANDNVTLITSAAYPNGSNDWQQIKLEFVAPPNAEAVGIRTVRAFCGANCPIFGAIWYDDFKLERIK